MAYTSEIDKLRQRFEANPDGRAFAPLADAYRKAGELDQALELVHQGLEKHPNYLSAHIVLARCLLDKADDAEARRSLEHVLSLDPENIIALKGLSEIEERAGHVDQSKKWLSTLLDVDPMNSEAREALERLEGGPAPADDAGAAAQESEEEPSVPEMEVAAGQSEGLAEVEGGGEAPAEAAEEEDAAPVEGAASWGWPPEDPPKGFEAGSSAEPEESPATVPEAEADATVAEDDDTGREDQEDARAAGAASGGPDLEIVAEEPVTALDAVDQTPALAGDAEAEVDQAGAGDDVGDLGIGDLVREDSSDELGIGAASASVGDLGVELSPTESMLFEPSDEAPEEIIRESASPGVELEPGGSRGSLEVEKFDGAVNFSELEETQPLDPVELEHEEVELTAADVEAVPVEGLAETQFDSAFGTADDTGDDATEAEAAAVQEIAEPEAVEADAEADAVEVEAIAESPAVEAESVEPEWVDEAAEGAEATEVAAEEDAEPVFEEDAALAMDATLGAVAGEDAELVGEASAELVDEEGSTDSGQALADLPLIEPERDSQADHPVYASLGQEDAAPDREALDEAEPVMTETMAELYAKQGHVEEARRIYRSLLATHPGDEQLQNKLDALTPQPKRAGAGEKSVGELFSALVASRPQAAPDASAGDAAEESVDEGPDEISESGEGMGDPAREGSDTISLEQIFGGAVPGSGAEAGPAPPKPGSGVSFDQFFSGGEQGSDTASPITEDEDDLAQFHHWLKGLKS